MGEALNLRVLSQPGVSHLQMGAIGTPSTLAPPGFPSPPTSPGFPEPSYQTHMPSLSTISFPHHYTTPSPLTYVVATTRAPHHYTTPPPPNSDVPTTPTPTYKYTPNSHYHTYTQPMQQTLD